MREIKNINNNLWEDVAKTSEGATFFQTPVWSQILIGEYPRFKILTRAFELDDKGIALIPLLETMERNRYFRWIESVYGGGYGGLLATRLLSEREIDAIYQKVVKRNVAHLHIIGNPFETQVYPDYFQKEDQFTHVLKISDYDMLYDNFSDDKKRNIKKALKLGVEICLAETLEDFRSYFHVYEDTLRRWGETTLVEYRFSLFERLFHHQSDAIKLWLAKVDGKIVSGKVVFYHNSRAFYWHGATLEEFFQHYPDPLLMSAIIRDACQKKLKYLDLGASGGIKGLEIYKEKFGAEKLPFWSYTWQENRLYQIYGNIFRNKK